MAKNMTLKGLAIGSAVALGFSGLAAAPAQAAITDTTKVTLTADSGDTLNVLVANNAAITVSSTVANSLRGAATTGLKWLVTDPSSKLTATFDNDANNTFTNNENSGSVGTRAADGSFIVDLADFTGELKLNMATATTTDYASTVTAWYDDNGNDVIDTDEYAASATLNWYLGSSVSSSVVVTSPIIGDTNIEGYIVTSPVLNYAQSTAPTVNSNWQNNSGDFAATVSSDTTNKRFKFVASRTLNLATTDSAARAVTTGVATFTVANTFAAGEVFELSGDVANANGTVAAAADGPFTVATAAAGNFTFDASDTGVTAVADAVLSTARTAKIQVIAGTYSFQPSVGTNKGTKTTISVAAATAADGTGSVSTGADVKATGQDTDSVAATVRAGTGSVTGQLAFVDSDGDAIGAGVPVRLTVAITNATGVKLNGVTKTNGQTLDVVTTAGGVVDFTVTNTSAAANDVITVTGVAEGIAGTSSAVAYTWSAGTNSLYDMNNAGTSAARVIAKGGSYTFQFAITDTWGVAPAGSWRLKVAVSGNTVSETYPELVNGVATVTVADAKIGSSNVTVAVTPQKLNTSAVWQDNGANSAVPAAQTFTLIPSDLPTAALTGSASNSGTIAVPTAALVAGDTRNSQLGVTTSGGFTISGVVSNAVTGVVQPGALVTVSGPANVLFYKGTVASFGSLSFYADATTGAYSFGATSNISQKESVVTVAAQGGTKSVKITFQAALATAGSALVIDAPEYVSAGSTLSITAKLTDKFGNPVKTVGADRISVTYSGPGLQVGSDPTGWDDDGLAKLGYFLGSNDSGTITVTFRYNQDGTDDVFTTTGKDLVVSKTITIGEAPAPAVEQKVNAGSFKGYVAVYARGYEGKRLSAKIGNDWVVVPSIVNNQENGTLFRVTDFTGAGVNISVRIYIDRVLLATIPLVTK